MSLALYSQSTDNSASNSLVDVQRAPKSAAKLPLLTKFAGFNKRSMRFTLAYYIEI